MPPARIYSRSHPRPVRPHRAGSTEWGASRRALLPLGCQVCGDTATELHHILSRDGDGTWPRGDDYRSNLAPLCHDCHRSITERDMVARSALRMTFTIHQLDYLKRRIGPRYEAYLERHYPKGGAA